MFVEHEAGEDNEGDRERLQFDAKMKRETEKRNRKRESSGPYFVCSYLGRHYGTVCLF